MYSVKTYYLEKYRDRMRVYIYVNQDNSLGANVDSHTHTHIDLQPYIDLQSNIFHSHSFYPSLGFIRLN